MKFVKPKFEIIEQPSGIEGCYKMIELAGRTAYKSEDKITENSAKEFVDRMIKLNHGAPLEHGTIYLDVPYFFFNQFDNNPYSKCVISANDKEDGLHYYITTNMRVIHENKWYYILKYMCEPTEYHEKRITVKFTCSRSISHEFVRHRVLSFLQESQRYVNYSKSKFNKELTYIQPCWLDSEKLKLYGNYHTVTRDKSPESIFIANLNSAERDYLDLIELGWKPQQAREVLPNATKTELIMTGFVSDWKHFFSLRCSESAHPQARELAIPLKEEFIKRGYL